MAAPADPVAMAEAPLRPAYYVYGPADADALARYLLGRLRERLGEVAGGGLEVVRLFGPEAGAQAATQARTRSLGGRRLIVADLEGEVSAALVQALALALEAPAPGVTLYVREAPPRGRASAALERLRKGPWGVRAAVPDRRAAVALLARMGDGKGIRWGSGAAACLFERVGEDLGLALGEIAKYRDVLAPGAALERATIEALTPAASAARVYPVGEAYLAADLPAALRAAQAALAAGDTPFGVAAWLARQARLLAASCAYVKARTAAGERPEAAALAAAVGVQPWQAKSLLAAALRRRPDPEGAAARLLEADIEMKGAMPAPLALDRLIIDLIAPARARERARRADAYAG